ncbi:uncharacterized protein [Rutidosis leptorrhynchoides]|uniref:uncharacterized protein n=1 Tax=Rutidosis leptorrhynchoides TaxID=125765 RepID=UPI003A99F649
MFESPQFNYMYLNVDHNNQFYYRCLDVKLSRWNQKLGVNIWVQMANEELPFNLSSIISCIRVYISFPLHSAASSGDVEVVKILLDRGALRLTHINCSQGL